MLFAVIGQCACMAILAGTVWDGGHAAGLVATVMLFLFNFFFGVGLLAIPWLCTFLLPYGDKVHDTNFHSACGILSVSHSYPIRSIGYGNQLYAHSSSLRCTTLTSLGIFTFLVVEITPVSIDNVGYRTYIYFAGMYYASILTTSR